MSTTKHKYRIQRLYALSIKRVSSGVELTAAGENTKGKRVDFVFILSWSYLPYVFRQIRNAWRDERSERFLELNALDREIQPAKDD